MGAAERLHQHLAALDAERRALLAQLAVAGPETLARQPRPGAWSVLEILDHLVTAERVILGGLADPATLQAARPRPAERLRRILVWGVLRFRIRVKVPTRRMLPQGGRDFAALRAAWDENLAWVRAFAEAGGGERGAVFRHPVGGPLTLAQALAMDRLHLRIHAAQIARILEG